MLMPHIFFTVNRLYPVEAREHTVPLNRYTPCQHWDRHLLLGSGASVPSLSTVTALLLQPGGPSYFLFRVKAASVFTTVPA